MLRRTYVIPMPCRLLGATPFLALRASQKNRHCSPTRVCYRPPGSWSSLLEYFFRASVNTSGRLGKFNLILMSWTFAGTTARAILLSLATTSTSYSSRRRKSTRFQRRKHTRSRRLFTYIDNMHNINNKNKINSSLNIDNTKTLTTTTTSSTFTSTSTPR